MAKEKEKLSALDRLIAQAVGEGRVLGADDDPAMEKWPTVWEWLSRIYIGQDNVRTPSPITIRLVPEGVQVSIVDKDLQSAVEVVFRHLGECFDRLEKEMSRPDCPIKSWGRKEPKLRRRSK